MLSTHNYSTIIATSSFKKSSSSSLRQPPRDGYDLPLYGIDDGSFYTVHVPALTCISVSLLCVSVILFLSCRKQHDPGELNGIRKRASFYKWSKGERFVIYVCVCDGLFNSFHLIDHIYILAIKNHVRPKQLCEFYGFMLVEFIGAQLFMVNLIAINAFLLIYFRTNIEFGKYDYRLLLWTFGMPLLTGCICLGIGALGPNGAL
jgi:G protein-coupled glucose receptor regulating Gpa2.